MTKPYKSCPPSETVEKITRLLKSVGIDWHFEHDISSNNGAFHSCHVTLSSQDLVTYSIGTNGKGRSAAFAHASALAELMERLQNNVLFPTAQHIFYRKNDELASRDPHFFTLRDKLENAPSFTYAPDESFISDPAEVERLVRKYVKSSMLDFFIRHFRESGLHTVPFCNLQTHEVEQLPVEPIFLNTGTNGMCAGNTPREAILQGICEVFERYAIRRFYLENLRFPTIPRDYFDGTDIGSTMEQIEQETHWKLVVKDCSCGLGIPVIGLLIIDQVRHKYQFRMGADTRATVALERCLSELYQGVENINMLDINLEEQVEIIENRQDNTKALRYILYRPENTAKHPASLFSETASYQFIGYDEEWGRSDEDDLRRIVAMLAQRGLKLYVRDVSFLGFPSYWVYIPGMSEVNNLTNVEYLALTRERQHHFRTAHHLDDATEREYYGLAQNIMSCYHQNSTLFTINTRDTWAHGNSQLLQALVSYRGGMEADARRILIHARNHAGTNAEKLLYSCLIDMITFPKGNYGTQFIDKIYPENIYKMAQHGLQGNLHELFNIGTCFHCDRCSIRESCNITPYLDLYIRICRIYSDNIPSQHSLRNV
ncbi:hypothetical protein CXU13_01355 [Akkermansia muciniphila]|nr:hypothetical protein CXU12_12925 [Akkermansia muciniphila]PNC61281.1 hypothetical protein CXU13_01355 [Akkermansia muciniphila]